MNKVLKAVANPIEEGAKAVSDAVTDATHPIEEKIHEATDDKLKEAGDAVSEAATGKKFKEGVQPVIRDAACTAVGGMAGGKGGASIGHEAAEAINNDSK
eukprot:TRINITY_DN11489_c0_g1_i1.p1 TRINITY_DN11489_c0_g1~~TRINITY_DN11489_c0_g1_i1.p1  ORF type:complete len:111 (-),score=47.83 TRINITY_DN11489_c0_g1_i1:255-554(-)